MSKNKNSSKILDELKNILISTTDKALLNIEANSVLGETVVSGDMTVVEIKNVSVGITDKKDKAERHKSKYLVIKNGKAEIVTEDPLKKHL